jgi:hypothetical protein
MPPQSRAIIHFYAWVRSHPVCEATFDPVDEPQMVALGAEAPMVSITLCSRRVAILWIGLLNHCIMRRVVK